jgi:hypothetical protein
MAMFSGPQGSQSKYGRHNKGVMKSYREIKRQEAEDRARTYQQKRANILAEEEAAQDTAA